MSIMTRRLTYDDLAQMPDDGKRYELIDGELVVSPSAIAVHQQVSGRLLDEFRPAVIGAGLGEVVHPPLDVRLSAHDVVQPDIMYISNERQPIVRRSYIDGAPDLVVEILSPSTRTYDEVRKARLYAAAGVREYWIVDIETETIRVFQLMDSGYELVPNVGNTARSLVIPGLEVDLSVLFRGLWRVASD